MVALYHEKLNPKLDLWEEKVLNTISKEEFLKNKRVKIYLISKEKTHKNWRLIDYKKLFNSMARNFKN